MNTDSRADLVPTYGIVHIRSRSADFVRETGHEKVQCEPVCRDKLHAYVPMWDYPQISNDLTGNKTKCLLHERGSVFFTRASKLYLVEHDRCLVYPRRVGRLTATRAGETWILYTADNHFGLLRPGETSIRLFETSERIWIVVHDAHSFILTLRRRVSHPATLLWFADDGALFWGWNFTGKLQPYHILIAEDNLLYVSSWDNILRFSFEEGSLRLFGTREFWDKDENVVPGFGNFMAYAPIDCMVYEKASRRLFITDQTSSVSGWGHDGALLWNVTFGYYGSNLYLSGTDGLWVTANSPNGGFWGYLSQDGEPRMSGAFAHGAIRSAFVTPEGELMLTDWERTGAWKIDRSGNIVQVYSCKQVKQ